MVVEKLPAAQQAVLDAAKAAKEAGAYTRPLFGST
jgi:hypothetical protein